LDSTSLPRTIRVLGSKISVSFVNNGFTGFLGYDGIEDDKEAIREGGMGSSSWR
jgi:hypothetical protein